MSLLCCKTYFCPLFGQVGKEKTTKTDIKWEKK